MEDVKPIDLSFIGIGKIDLVDVLVISILSCDGLRIVSRPEIIYLN